MRPASSGRAPRRSCGRDFGHISGSAALRRALVGRARSGLRRSPPPRGRGGGRAHRAAVGERSFGRSQPGAGRLQLADRTLVARRRDQIGLNSNRNRNLNLNWNLNSEVELGPQTGRRRWRDWIESDRVGLELGRPARSHCALAGGSTARTVTPPEQQERGGAGWLAGGRSTCGPPRRAGLYQQRAERPV